MRNISKIVFILLISAFFLIGCSNFKYGTINVETRSYSGDIGGLEYTPWNKEVPVEVEKGALVYSNGQISVSVGQVYADGIRLQFSEPVTLANSNQNANNFYIKRNKTETFVAGGGVTGLEIKFKYN